MRQGILGAWTSCRDAHLPMNMDMCDCAQARIWFSARREMCFAEDVKSLVPQAG